MSVTLERIFESEVLSFAALNAPSRFSYVKKKSLAIWHQSLPSHEDLNKIDLYSICFDIIGLNMSIIL